MKFRLVGIVVFICSLLFPFSSLQSATLTVDCKGGGDYLTIQEGIDAAVDGDTVLVYPCLYSESIGFGSKAIVVRSVMGPEVTVIQATSSWYPVVGFNPDVDSMSVLEGFKLVAAPTGDCINTRGSPKVVGNVMTGGTSGINIFSGSQMIIRNNVFYDCYWAMYISSPPREVKGNIIHRLYTWGTGIYIDGCGANPCTVEGNWILGVSATRTEYGFSIQVGRPTIRNNVLIGDYRGAHPMALGTLVWSGASPEIYNNIASGFVGGLSAGSDYPDPLVVNNVFSYNETGIKFYSGLTTAFNNVVVGSNGPDEYGVDCDAGGDVILGYNDVWGNAYGDYSPSCDPGPGSISEDPLFVDPAHGHYSLDPVSPCIDAGDPMIVDTDGTRSDMGAFGGPKAKAVNLSLYSLSGLVVSRGDTLRMGAIVSNNLQVAQEVTLDVDLYLATGYPYGRNPVTGPVALSLGPLETVSPNPEFEYTVPQGISPGLYRLVGVLRDTLGLKVDEEFLVYMVD